MPDDGYITCDCGYEIFVPEARRGSMVECLLCGAEIDTAATEPGERTVAEVPLPPSSKQEAPSFSSSPFEGDDDDPIISRPSISDHLDAQPKASSFSASAFEDEDEDEDDEDEVGAPDSPTPDPSLIRSYHDPEHSSAYQNVQNAETCPKCGNPYRGDWDKQSIAGEEMCYICSSQATEKIPDRIVQKEAVAPNPVTAQSGWNQSVNVDIPDGPMEEVPWFKDPESPGFRKMIYSMAIGLIAVTIVAVFTTNYSPPPKAPSTPDRLEAVDQPENLPELPAWATLTYWVMVGTMGFVGQFASFYLLLSLTNRLPNGDFVGDCITIGYCMFWLTVASVLYFAAAYFVSDMLMARIWMMGISVIFGFMMIIIVINILDFRIRDFFYLAWIVGPVYALLALPAAFLYALLAKIAL